MAGSETIEAIRLDAKPAPDGSDLVLQARARGFALDGAARLVPAAHPRLDLSRFSAVRVADRLTLAGPATVTVKDEGVTVAGLAIAAGSGRAHLDGTIGKTLDLRLGLKSLPLAMARIASPSLNLSGILDGEAALTGPAASPEGRYSLSVSRLVTPETRSAGLPPIDAKASGRIEDGRAGLDGTVNAGRGVQIALSGSIPVEAGGTLALRTRGTVDAALANTLLAAGGQRLTGRVALDAGIGGTLQAPKIDGSAVLTGGSFTDPLNGVSLTDIQGLVAGRGDTLVIERLTAATRNGGTLQVQGRVAVEPAAGFPGNLTIRADRAELVSSQLMTLITGLNLSLTGPLARTPRVSGQVDVVSLDVSVPDRLPATVQPLPGIRHVNTPPQMRARPRRGPGARRRPGAAARPRPSSPPSTSR